MEIKDGPVICCKDDLLKELEEALEQMQKYPDDFGREYGEEKG